MAFPSRWAVYDPGSTIWGLDVDVATEEYWLRLW